MVSDPDSRIPEFPDPGFPGFPRSPNPRIRVSQMCRICRILGARFPGFADLGNPGFRVFANLAILGIPEIPDFSRFPRFLQISPDFPILTPNLRFLHEMALFPKFLTFSRIWESEISKFGDSASTTSVDLDVVGFGFLKFVDHGFRFHDLPNLNLNIWMSNVCKSTISCNFYLTFMTSKYRLKHLFFKLWLWFDDSRRRGCEFLTSLKALWLANRASVGMTTTVEINPDLEISKRSLHTL